MTAYDLFKRVHNHYMGNFMRHLWTTNKDNTSPKAYVEQSFEEVLGEYEVVYVYEGCDTGDPWKIYDPELPPAANDLQYVDSAKGFWVEAKKDAELTVGGFFPTSLSIPLCVGWNLIS